MAPENAVFTARKKQVQAYIHARGWGSNDGADDLVDLMVTRIYELHAEGKAYQINYVYYWALEQYKGPRNTVEYTPERDVRFDAQAITKAQFDEHRPKCGLPRLLYTLYYREGYTQRELGEMLGVHPSRLSQIMSHMGDTGQMVYRRHNTGIAGKRPGVLWEGEITTYTELGRRYGIGRKTIYTRLRSGWPLERAITEPIHRREKYESLSSH